MWASLWKTHGLLCWNAILMASVSCKEAKCYVMCCVCNLCLPPSLNFTKIWMRNRKLNCYGKIIIIYASPVRDSDYPGLPLNEVRGSTVIVVTLYLDYVISYPDLSTSGLCLQWDHSDLYSEMCLCVHMWAYRSMHLRKWHSCIAFWASDAWHTCTQFFACSWSYFWGRFFWWVPLYYYEFVV